MAVPYLSLLLFITALTISTISAQDSIQVGRFFNPPNALAEPTLNFSTNPVWRVGGVETIKFTTVYSNYTISLWQQNLDGGSASLGPSIFQTQSGAVTQFDWSVQLFGFDLETSNIFFLWLTPLETSEDDPLSVTSRYFNITADAASSTSSSISSSSTVSSTATTFTSSVTAASSSTSAASTDSSSVSLSQSSKSRPPGSLSTGAQAGIGVGAALVGIAAITGAFFFVRQQRRRQKNSENARSPNDGSQPDMMMTTARSPFGEERQSKPLPPLHPTELDAGGPYAGPFYHDPREPAELS
ncbi:hypothetical protein F4677DRAFT_425620 [Hypoxylon crocopeplum]|nr:hypothetical protein F4677DRAFT_425620 [Hypoxylon crocopeplum]